MPVISGFVNLPDSTTRVPGTLYATIVTSRPDGAEVGDQVGEVLGGTASTVDSGSGITMTLAAGWYLFNFESRDLDAFGDPVLLGPWRYQVTGDTTVAQVLAAQPVGDPITPSQYDQLLALIQQGGGGGGGVALGETASTAYRGDRGKTAYDHSQATGNPHGTTAAQVGAATPADVATASTADRARANHTGTQNAATITDLTETVQDIVAAFIVAGTNVTVSYNDTANTYTINAAGGGGGGSTDPEVVRDTIGGALVAGSGVQIAVNDVGDTITISSTAVLPTRQVVAGTGLTGGGDLSTDRTLAVVYGTAAGTAAQGNDSRLSDARPPMAHTHPASHISDATTIGRAVVTAADAAAARTVLGVDGARTVSTTASTATLTPDATSDRAHAAVTALAGALTIAAPTGSPVDFASLLLRIKDDGTARALTWNAVWRGLGMTLPSTTTAGKTMYVGARYNGQDSRWDVLSIAWED